MSEYIEREAVLLHLNDIWLSASPTDTMYDDDRQLAMVRCMGLNDAMDVVKDAPAADVRPVVRADWYGEADGYADGELVYDMWSCPICGKRFEEWEEKPGWNFCPNCGADMRGVDNG